jgi:hypothetical protein
MTAPVRRVSMLAAMAAAFVVGALVPLALAQPTARATDDCAQLRAERDGFRARERRATRAAQRVRRGMVADQQRLTEVQRGLDEARRRLDIERVRLGKLEKILTPVGTPMP